MQFDNPDDDQVAEAGPPPEFEQTSPASNRHEDAGPHAGMEPSPLKPQSLSARFAAVSPGPASCAGDHPSTPGPSPRKAVEGELEDETPPGSEAVCFLCNKRPRAKKQRCCTVCKADIQAARRDSETAGEGAWFQTMAKKGGSEFVEFMYEYIKKQSSARRKYSQRLKFDFVSYKEAKRVQSSLKLGFKAWLWRMFALLLRNHLFMFRRGSTIRSPLSMKSGAGDWRPTAKFGAHGQ